MTSLESPYFRLVQANLPSYEASQLNQSSVLNSLAEACRPIDSALVNVIGYEDDAIMGARAAPQLTQLAMSTDDQRSVEVMTMLSSKQACRQGLATHPQIVTAVVHCLPSQGAVQAIASMSRDPALASAFDEAGTVGRMVTFFGNPQLQKDAVIALRNLLANQSADTLRATTLPNETVPSLCQFVNSSAYPLELLAPSADCLRLIGNTRSGSDSFRSMLALGNAEGSLAERMVTVLLQSNTPRDTSGQRKACIAVARLIAAMSADEQCRQILVEIGAIQALSVALVFIRSITTSTDFQPSASSAILLALRNVSESIELSVLSAAHSLSTMPHGIDQVVVAFVDVFANCLGKIPATAIAYCAGALANLVSECVELKEVAVLRGAVDWLVQAATLDSEVVEPAFVALAHLTARHPAANEAQSALLQAGAMERLFRVLTPAASTAAAALARNLMLSPAGRLAMVEHVGVLTTLLSGPACGDAAAALWLLCRDAGTNSCGVLVQHGVVPAASRLLFDDENSEAQCAAAALLWQLAQSEPSAVGQMDQEGVASPLTQLLHSSDQSAATYAAALLRRLSENRPPAFRQRMNTELVQSLSSGNIGLMSQSFPAANGLVHSPDEANATQGGAQWLDTDL